MCPLHSLAYYLHPRTDVLKSKMNNKYFRPSFNYSYFRLVVSEYLISLSSADVSWAGLPPSLSLAFPYCISVSHSEMLKGFSLKYEDLFEKAARTWLEIHLPRPARKYCVTRWNLLHPQWTIIIAACQYWLFISSSKKQSLVKLFL